MNSEQFVAAIVAFIGGGAASALIVQLATRRKTNAETTDLIGASWDRVVARLEAIIARLEDEKRDEEAKGDTLSTKVAELEAEVRALRVEVARLRRLLVSHGVDPQDDDDNNKIGPGL